MNLLIRICLVVGAVVFFGATFSTSSTVFAQSEDDVVINEFSVNPTSGKEYVELLVTRPGGVNMQGWTLSDVGTRAGATAGTEGDVTLPAATYLANVPQGTFVVIVFTTPAANTNTLAEDTSLTDGNRKLVLIVGTTTGLTTAGTIDNATADNLQLYAGTRATGTLIDQVLVGNNSSYITGATFGDNNGATTTDNINGSSAMPSNSIARFAPTADTVAAFQNNDTGARFVVDANSYGTPGAPNTGVNSDRTLTGNIVISEFRFRGINGTDDEFIELYNDSDSPFTINSNDSSAGWVVTSEDNIARINLANGLILPARSHYLAQGNGYSLFNVAASDAGYGSEIPDNSGIAIFNTQITQNFTTANRVDAVGFTTASSNFREGAGLPTPVTSNAEFSFVRRSASSTTDGSGLSGIPRDTGDNAADFVLVATVPSLITPTTLAALGAPGPENTSSPTFRSRTEVAPQLLQPTSAGSASPNRAIVACGVQGAPACPADPNTSRGDYIAIRRSFTNNSGATITRLRFRIIDLTTLNNTDGLASPADLRAVTSSDIFIAPSGFQANVFGTTLEQPPTQTLGGGLNSTLNVANLPGGGLASTVGGNCPGGSTCTIGVQFILGIKTGGAFRFFVSTEATNAAPVQTLTATSDETEKGSDKK